MAAPSSQYVKLAMHQIPVLGYLNKKLAVAIVTHANGIDTRVLTLPLLL